MALLFKSGAGIVCEEHAQQLEAVGGVRVPLDIAQRFLEGGQRMYNVLARFDTRDESYNAELVRTVREGWERSHPGMDEDDAWSEFDMLWNRRD